MDDPRRATSADVARRAGVSRATVSYVLNDRRDQAIPEQTRQRVREAARELGYTPNAAARSLRAGRSRLVLLVNNGIPLGPSLSRIIDALTTEVTRAGLSLVLWQRTADGGLADALSHVDALAVISLGRLGPTERVLFDQTGLPVIDAGLNGDLAPGDQNAPARLQVQHLAERGHRRIGVLSTADPLLRDFATVRTEGARAACLAAGLPDPAVAEVPTGDALSVATVAEMLTDWRSGPDPVTAVCCYNDYLGAATVAAAADLGLDVPRDLAVIGVDDEPFAQTTRPALTTLAADFSGFAAEVWARTTTALGQDGDVPAGARVAPMFRVQPRAST